MVMAPLNAYNSVLPTPYIGPVLAPIAAAAALVTASLQFAAVEKAKPAAPKFAVGGIVPGTSYTGDKVTIQANSKEAVLTQAQQARFMAIANGADTGQERTTAVPRLSPSDWLNAIWQASQDGLLRIADRAVVPA